METIDWSLADGTKVRRFDFATGGGKKSVLEIVWKCRIPRVSFVTAILHFNLRKKVRKDEIRVVAGIKPPSARTPRHLERSPDNRAGNPWPKNSKGDFHATDIDSPSPPNDIHTYMHISQKFRNVSQRKKKPTFTTVDYLIYILNYAIFATWRIKKPARFLHERARRH